MDSMKRRNRLHSFLSWVLILAMLSSNTMSVWASETAVSQSANTGTESESHSETKLTEAGTEPASEEPKETEKSSESDKAKDKDETQNETEPEKQDSEKTTEKKSETENETETANKDRTPKGDEEGNPVQVTLSWKGTDESDVETTSILTTCLKIDIKSGSYAKDGIEVWLPDEYFVGRNGENLTDEFREDGSYYLPVPHDKPPTDGKSFYYTRETKDGKGYYVIKNWFPISANGPMMEFTYSYSADHWGYIKNNTKLELSCLVKYKPENGAAGEYDTNKLTQTIKTHVYKGTGNTKEFVEKYEVWNDAWGTEPTGADKYFYVKWKLTRGEGGKNGTQFSDLYYEENPGNNGEVVAWQINRQDGSPIKDDVPYTAPDKLGLLDGKPSSITFEDEEKNTHTAWYITNNEASPATGGMRSWREDCVIVRYPRDQINKEGKTILENGFRAYYVGKDGDSGISSWNSGNFCTAEKEYEEVNFTYPSDKFEVWKTNRLGTKPPSGSHEKHDVSVAGALSAIKSNKDAVGFNFLHQMRVKAYQINQGGKANYTAELRDDLIFLKGVRLNQEDFIFTSLKLEEYTQFGYERDEDKGIIEKPDTDYGAYPELELWTLEAEASAYTLAGKIKRTGEDSYSFNGQSGSSITLPANTSGVKVLYQGKCDEYYLRLQLDGTLKSTANVKSIVQDTQAPELININDMVVRDSSGAIKTDANVNSGSGSLEMIDQIHTADRSKYECIVGHDYSKRSLDDVMKKTRFEFGYTSYTPNIAESRDVISYRAEFQEVWEAQDFSEQEFLDLSDYKPHNKDTSFYLLLPRGTNLIEESVSISSYSDSRAIEGFDISYKDNWKGSDRQMVVITPRMKAGEDNVSAGNGTVSTGYAINFKLNYDWIAKAALGTRPVLEAAYRIPDSMEQNLGSGYLDDGRTNPYDPTAGPQYPLLEDLDGNSTLSAYKGTAYSSAAVSLGILTSIEAGLKKQVKNTNDALYSATTSVRTGDKYSYRFAYATSGDARTKGVIIYDSLESNYDGNTHWKGTFDSINLSILELIGCDPVVYYSTTPDLDIKANQDLTGPAWTATQPINKADITAIAVDCSKAKDGSPHVFDELEGGYFIVNMIAPATLPPAASRAYNAANLKQDMSTDYGVSWSSREMVETSPATQVEVVAPPTIIKASEPAGAVQKDQITSRSTIKLNGEILYKLEITNPNAITELNNVVITDVIPDGLTLNLYDCEYYWNDDPNNQQGAAGNVRMTSDESKVTVTVGLFPAGDKLTLLIPTTAAVSSETYFENRARITSYNSQAITPIESNVVWHKAEAGDDPEENIEIVKSANPAGVASQSDLTGTNGKVAYPAGTIDYSIKITNKSTKTLYNYVRVRDTLSYDLTVASDVEDNIKYYIGDNSSNQIACSDPSSIVKLTKGGVLYTFMIKELAENSSITIVIPTSYSGLTATTEFMNQAEIDQVEGETVDIESNEVWHKAEKPVLPSDNLTIQKSANPAGAANETGLNGTTGKVPYPSGSIKYSLKVANSSTTLAYNNVKVTDTLPAGLTVPATFADDIKYYLGNNSSNQVSCSDGSSIVAVSRSGETYTFTISALAANEAVTIVIPASYSGLTVETKFKNQAKISEVDGTAQNIESNEVWHKAEVPKPAEQDLEIEKSADPVGAPAENDLSETVGKVSYPSGTINYSVKITNTSTVNKYNNIKLKDILPAGLSIPGSEAAAIKYYLGDDSTSQVALNHVSSIVKYDRTGKEYTFTIAALDEDSSITIVIPTAYSGLTAATTFKNQATLTEASDVLFTKNSNEVWHRAPKPVPQVSITKTAGVAWADKADEIAPGNGEIALNDDYTKLLYYVQVQNDGSTDLPNVVVKDVLPNVGGADYTTKCYYQSDPTDNRWTYSRNDFIIPNASDNTFKIYNLKANDTFVIEMAIYLSKNADTDVDDPRKPFKNQAEIISVDGDDFSKKSNEVWHKLVDGLTLSKSADPAGAAKKTDISESLGTVELGDELTYSLVLKNYRSSGEYKDVLITDKLPGGLSYDLSKVKYEISSDPGVKKAMGDGLVSVTESALQYDYQKVDSESVSTYVRTKTLSFTVSSIPADTTITIYIPVTAEKNLQVMEDSGDVSYTITDYIYYQNTARIASVNSVNASYSTDAVHHKAVRKKEYNVTYAPGSVGAAQNMPTPLSTNHIVGSTVTVKNNVPTADGYIFIGWKSDDDNEIYKNPLNASSPTSFTMPEKDVVLTAQWKDAIKHQIVDFNKIMTDKDGDVVTSLPAMPKAGDKLYYSVNIELPADMTGYESLIITDTLPTNTQYDSAKLVDQSKSEVAAATVTSNTAKTTVRAAITNTADLKALAGKTLTLQISVNVTGTVDNPIKNTAKYWANPADSGDSENEPGGNPGGKTEVETPITDNKFEKRMVNTSGEEVKSLPAAPKSGDTLSYEVSLQLPASMDGYESLVIWDDLPTNTKHVSSKLVDASGTEVTAAAVAPNTAGDSVRAAITDKAKLKALAGKKLILKLTVEVTGTVDNPIRNEAKFWVSPVDPGDEDTEPGTEPGGETDTETPITDNKFEKMMVSASGEKITSLPSAPKSGDKLSYEVSLQMPASMNGYESLVIWDDLPTNTKHVSSKLVDGSGTEITDAVVEASTAGDSVRAAIIDETKLKTLAGKKLILKLTVEVTGTVDNPIKNEAKFWVNPSDPGDKDTEPGTDPGGETETETPITDNKFEKRMVNTSGEEVKSLSSIPKVGDKLSYEVSLQLPTSLNGYESLVIWDDLPKNTKHESAKLVDGSGNEITDATVEASNAGDSVRAAITDKAKLALLAGEKLVLKLTVEVTGTLDNPIKNEAKFWINPTDPGDKNTEPGTDPGGETDTETPITDNKFEKRMVNAAGEEIKSLKEKPQIDDRFSYEVSLQLPTDMGGYESLVIWDDLPTNTEFVLAELVDGSGNTVFASTVQGSTDGTKVRAAILSEAVLKTLAGQTLTLKITVKVTGELDNPIKNEAKFWVNPTDPGDKETEPGTEPGGEAEVETPITDNEFIKKLVNASGEEIKSLKEVPAVGDMLSYEVSIQLPTNMGGYESLIIWDDLPTNTKHLSAKLVDAGGTQIADAAVAPSSTGDSVRAAITGEAKLKALAGQKLTLKLTVEVTGTVDNPIRNEAKFWVSPADPGDKDKEPGTDPGGETEKETPITDNKFKKRMVNTKGEEVTSLKEMPKVGEQLSYDVTLQLPVNMGGYESLVIWDDLPTGTKHVSSKLVDASGAVITAAKVEAAGSGRSVRAAIMEEAALKALSGQILTLKLTIEVTGELDNPIRNEAKFWLNPTDPGDKDTEPGTDPSGETEKETPITDNEFLKKMVNPDGDEITSLPSAPKTGEQLSYEVSIQLPANMGGYESLIIRDDLPGNTKHVSSRLVDGSGAEITAADVAGSTDGSSVRAAITDEAALKALAGQKLTLKLTVEVTGVLDNPIKNVAKFWVSPLDPGDKDKEPGTDPGGETEKETPITDNEFTKKLVNASGEIVKSLKETPQPGDKLSYEVDLQLPDDMGGYESLIIWDNLPKNTKHVSAQLNDAAGKKIDGAKVEAATGGKSVRAAITDEQQLKALAGQKLTLQLTVEVTGALDNPIRNEAKFWVNPLVPGDKDKEPGTDPGGETDTETPITDNEFVKKMVNAAGEEVKSLKEMPNIGDKLSYEVSIKLPTNMGGYESLIIRDNLPRNTQYASAQLVDGKGQQIETAQVEGSTDKRTVRAAITDEATLKALAGQKLTLKLTVEVTGELDNPVRNEAKFWVNPADPGDKDKEPGTDPDGETDIETNIKGTFTIDVKKFVVFNGKYRALDYSFYAALFWDEACTKPASDVIELKLSASYSTKAQFKNLGPGTYYIAETDADGNLMDTSGPKAFYTNEITKSKFTMSKSNPADYTEITNYLSKLPVGPLYEGEIEISKKVVAGKAKKEVTDTFYFTLYTDEELTNIVETASLELKKASAGKVSFTKLALGEYFIAESDKDGNPVDESFEYEVSMDKDQINLTAKNAKQTVKIINDGDPDQPDTDKKNPPATRKPSKTTTIRTTRNVRTGDDTESFAYVVLLVGAALMIAGSIAVRRKKREEQ